MGIPEPERLKAWVRAGGRCAICNRYLLDGQLTYKELTFGELAHIVGQKKSAKSPRGLDESLDPAKRDTADNVVLVCDDEHDELDKAGSRDVFSVEWLREMKRRHEEHIFHVTGLAEDRTTAPIRMIGSVRGNQVEVDRGAAAAAVIHCASRFPRFALSYRDSIEIDLRSLAGEADGSEAYYAAATGVIDDVVGHKVRDGIARDQLSHLSVFAFARLPLLVYLGSALDDTVPIDIYQRHRSTDAWEWPDPDATATFDVSVPAAAPAHDEAVLVLNVSGSIGADEVPQALGGLPRFSIEVSGTPSPDVMRGPACVNAFRSACRALLARTEAEHKHLRRFHVLAALPLSAAVALGQVPDFAVHPSLLIYDRGNDGYTPALEVGER